MIVSLDFLIDRSQAPCAREHNLTVVGYHLPTLYAGWLCGRVINMFIIFRLKWLQQIVVLWNG